MVERCDSCGEELEIGQIGECDECQAEREDSQALRDGSFQHGAGVSPSRKMVHNVERVTVNRHSAIKTQLTVRKGSFSFARSAIGKMPSSGEFAWLMGILEGQLVTATVFSGTNVVGHTSAVQIRQALLDLNPEYSFWIKEPQLQAVIAKFGDGQLGFSMSGMYCEQTPAELEKLIASVKDEPQEDIRPAIRM